MSWDMKSEVKTNAGVVKPGMKIHIVELDDPYDDSYNGREGVVEFIDDAGQLHGTWGGLAVCPEVDVISLV